MTGQLQRRRLGLWLIRVGGYGQFLVRASEQGAEQMRRHKATWEQAPASKTLIPEAEEEAALDKHALYYWPAVLDDEGLSSGPHVPRTEANPYVA